MKPNVVPGSSLLVLRIIVGALCLLGPLAAGCTGSPEAAAGAGDNSEGGAGGTIDENIAGQGGAAGEPRSGGAAGIGFDAGVSILIDAGQSSKSDSGFSSTPVPAGLVPVVVALGPGGRTAVSCNGGRGFRVNDFHKTPDDDHSPYAVTGLAGGTGAIVASLGWGAAGRIVYSDDGVDWQELSADRYTNRSGGKGPSTDSTSGAFFDGSLYKVFWSRKVWSSPDGLAWKETAFEPMNISHIRDVEFFPEARLLVVRVERDEGGGRNFLMMTSSDLGQTYKLWSPRTTGCPGFEWGPVAYSNGVIVAGGSSGSVCRSEDGGAKWTTVPNVANITTLFTDASAFYMARGDELLRSEDGNTWQRVLKANAALSRGVWSAQTGAVVAANANGQLKFFRSDDGKTWTPSAGLMGGSFGVSRMRVAFVKPNPKCPGL